MKLTFFVLFLIVISFFVSESFAAQITINTNKQTFAGGDTVELSGTVDGGSAGDLVALEIKDPSGETILIRTVQLGSGGTFNLQFKLPASGQSGSYDIIANAQIAGQTVTETKTITKSSQSSVATSDKGGGCLIATATYGSELAPQVQQLREIRDNALLQTESGSTFMTGFNQFYYSFSPTIADWERENPIFKEALKFTITPLITSLSILNYVDIDSEAEILGYGISLILLNVGMYFVVPALLIFRIKKLFN